MSALSVAATAAASSSSPASSAAAFSIDHFSNTKLRFSFKPTLGIKYSNSKPHNLHKYPPTFSRISLPFNFCASSGFGGSEELLGEEEEEEYEQSEEETEAATEGGDEEREVPEPAEARRLYVGNLPFSMTSSQLSDVFAEAGRVVSSEVVYDRVTDRSRGFAFITMGSVEEAKEAIRLFNGSQVGGRTIRVNFPEVPRGGEREVLGTEIRSSNQGFVDTPHKIYAGNLSWAITSKGLRETFQDQPGFLSAKVIYDRDTGRSRGFGFVTFDSAEAVEAALNGLNGMELEGRPLRLNIAEQRASPLSPLPPKTENYSAEGMDSSEVFSGISS